ncbi:MAG: glycosyltransferase [Chthoniobacterales bacterium]
MPKRILILTAGFGEGHNAAARGIRDGLLLAGAERSVVEMRDVFSETYGLMNDLVRRSYLALINRAPAAWSGLYEWIDRQANPASKLRVLFQAKNRLCDLLAQFQPDVVVSVFPAYSHLLDAIVGQTPPPFRRIVCVTDSITVNAIWHRCRCDCFYVPNDETAAVLAAAGVAPDRVQVTGFPVAPSFAQLGPLRQPPSDEYGRRILHMINPGRVVDSEVIRRLAKIPATRLTVAVGKDNHLRRTVEAITVEAGRKFEVVGWSDQLPRLMLESHLLVGKAGGAMVQEAIAAGCPMIINQIVPGQEEGNARLLRGTNSAVLATTPDAIVAAVEEAFADDARVWREWSANISRLSRPNAARDIAERLIAL